ncbi:MAG TPA: hypothetical protein VHG92_05285 [Afifellaceae bacterium]|nr:hypothetical protein [Afifellaceae bacterium]
MSALVIAIILFSAAAVVFLLIVGCRSARIFLKKYSSAFTFLFALVAAGYTLYEYDQRQHQERQANTLEYISRSQVGSVSQSRKWYDEFLLDHEELVRALLSGDVDTSSAQEGDDSGLREELGRGRDALEAAWSEQQQNRRHIIDLFTYYADVAMCVNQNICDASAACEYFGNDIGALQVSSNRLIQSWRKISFERRYEAIREFLRKCAGMQSD